MKVRAEVCSEVEVEVSQVNLWRCMNAGDREKLCRIVPAASYSHNVHLMNAALVFFLNEKKRFLLMTQQQHQYEMSQHVTDEFKIFCTVAETDQIYWNLYHIKNPD